MTLDAGKSLRSVIVTEKDELMVVQDHTYPTCSKFLKCDYWKSNKPKYSYYLYLMK